LLFTAVSRGTLKYDTITLVPVVEPASVSLLMLRTSGSLTVAWAKYVNGVGDPAENFIPVTIGNDDGIYVGVEVNSTLTAGTDVITNPGPGSTNYTDGILKLNEFGTPVWLKSVTTNAHVWSVFNNRDGSGVFCGGDFSGSLTLGNFTIKDIKGSSFITKIAYNGTFKNAFAFAAGPGSKVKSMATNEQGVFYVGGKLFSRTVPTFSCTPRVANTGLYLAKFTEEPDEAPQPSITRSGIELTASPVFNEGRIQWNLNGNAIPGATHQTYTAAENGDYTVSYFYSYDLIPLCISTSAKMSVISVGLSENKSNRFAVYPNPLKNEITVDLKELTGPTTVTVFDYSGRKLVEKEISNALQKLDLGFLSNGVYVIQLRNPEGVFTKRIVKQK